MDGDPTTLRWTFLGWDALRFSWPYVAALVIGVVGPMWLELSKRRREKLIADAVAEATRRETQQTPATVVASPTVVAAPVAPIAVPKPEPTLADLSSAVVQPMVNGPISKRAEREARRLKAWQLYQQGVSQVEIARTLGVTRGAVSQWMKTAREEGGPDALIRKAATGRPSRLSKGDKTRLAGMLEETPQTYGFDVPDWNNTVVAELIEREFDVSYHPVHVARLLKKLKSSVQ